MRFARPRCAMRAIRRRASSVDHRTLLSSIAANEEHADKLSIDERPRRANGRGHCLRVGRSADKAKRARKSTKRLTPHGATRLCPPF